MNPQPPPRLATLPAEVLAQIGDAVPWPLLVLRRDATLLLANLAARQLLHRGRPFEIDFDLRVRPADRARRAGFAATVAAGGPSLLQWPAPAACCLTLQPLDLQAQGPLLLALSTAASCHAALHAFARMHALSDAETRVLEQLVRGHSVAATAAALGITPAAVRSRRASLQRKSGHASVTALVRALATLPPLAALQLVQAPARTGTGE